MCVWLVPHSVFCKNLTNVSNWAISPGNSGHCFLSINQEKDQLQACISAKNPQAEAGYQWPTPYTGHFLS